MQPQFRQASPKEIQTLVACQVALAWETEKLRLDVETVTKGMESVFAVPSRGQYHVCVWNDQVVGMLLITTEWSDWRNGVVWWLHSLYLQPETRGQGLFSKMYDYVIELIKADPQIKGLRLYVDHTNQNAQKVYEKLGMSSEHYKMYEWMKP